MGGVRFARRISMKNENQGVPPQVEGKKYDTSEEARCQTVAEAKQLFNAAAARLLNINQWYDIARKPSAKFQLVDSHGMEVDGDPQVAYYMRIDLPVAGPDSGDGYDWVRIEEIRDERNGEAEEESLTIRVRPSSPPFENDDDPAHFFTTDASSSFRVQRSRQVVTAEVHGRNEKPNTEGDTLIEKVRNAVVGLGAILGFSHPQWSNLVKGILDPKPADTD